MTTLEAHASGPVAAKLTDGVIYQFQRVTPTILIELGSYHRAVTAGGSRWLSLDECMLLVQTVEGMRWLAWRCAVKSHPEFAGEPGRHKFTPLLEDFGLLCDITGAITAQDDDADPPVNQEAVS